MQLKVLAHDISMCVVDAVTLAESGLEALEALRQHKPGTYQLVLAVSTSLAC